MDDDTLRGYTFDLIAQFMGQQNILAIPRAFISILGSLDAALVLSQIIYWSDRATMKNGWFAKSYAEWEDELSLSKYQIGKAVKALKPAGIETKVKKFDGSPVVHYHVDKQVFSQWIVKKLDELGKSKNLTNQSAKTSQSSTETSAETTAKTTTKKSAQRAADENPKPFNIMKDAICTAFRWDKPTKSEWGQIQGAAKQLLDAECDPADIQSLYDFCKSECDGHSFTPLYLPSKYSTWKTHHRPKPKPVIDYSKLPDDQVPLDVLAARQGIFDDGTPATPEQIAEARRMFDDLVKAKSGNGS